jgi:hypothetical protein
MYFRANNTRAHGLGVDFTDVEHIGIELWQGSCQVLTCSLGWSRCGDSVRRSVGI